MTVIFYNTNSNKFSVDKILNDGWEYTAVKLKENTSMLNPTIIIEGHRDIHKNYCYIPMFNRYYFMSEPTILTGNRVQYKLTVDVLTTYANEIKNSEQVIIRDNTGSTYIPDTKLPLTPYNNIKIAKFSENPFFNSMTDNSNCFLLCLSGK